MHIFLHGYEAAEKRVQNASYQFIMPMLTHAVAAAMLDSILALNLDNFLRSDLSMNSIAERITNNRQFMEPILTRAMERKAVLADSKCFLHLMTVSGRSPHP